jgi:DNA end-binding protein Ku
MYYDGRVYYLVPETPSANQPYNVLCQAMQKLNRCGVATITLRGKEQLLMVRPIRGVLTMIMLHYESQIREPEAVRDEVPQEKASVQELKLAQQLIQASTSSKFDFSSYEDRYTDRLKALIESKIQGKEIIEPPQAEEEVPVINLMDALRKSVQKSKQSPKAKQARKALSSRLSRTGETQKTRRRKSS